MHFVSLVLINTALQLQLHSFQFCTHSQERSTQLMLLLVWGTCSSWACSSRRDIVESTTETHTMPHLPTKVKFVVIEHRHRWSFIWCCALARVKLWVPVLCCHFLWQKKKEQTMNTMVCVICDLTTLRECAEKLQALWWNFEHQGLT